jgi:hypothetical protein
MGAPISGASAVAGIAVSTLGEWRERHNELERGIAEAGDWQAYAEWRSWTVSRFHRALPFFALDG